MLAQLEALDVHSVAAGKFVDEIDPASLIVAPTSPRGLNLAPIVQALGATVRWYGDSRWAHAVIGRALQRCIPFSRPGIGH